MKRIKLTRTLASLAAATAIVAGGMVAAAPASAGTANCPSGSFCLWQHPDFNGERLSGSYGMTNTTSAITDQASSLQNNGNSCNTTVYSEFNGGGRRAVVQRGYAYPRLSQYRWDTDKNKTLDDDIRSFSWC
jgi:hypothetical protein